MTTTVSASAVVPVELPRLAKLLTEDPMALLPPPPAGGAPGTFKAVVELPGGTSIAQAVAARVGPAEVSDGRCTVTLAWTPLGHRGLLPSFEGTVEVVAGVDPAREACALHLVGTYEPPLRRAGAMADHAVGPRIAGPTLRALARSFARRLTDRCLREDYRAPWRPPAYPEPLRDALHVGGDHGH
jgi:hypothetical protein